AGRGAWGLRRAWDLAQAGQPCASPCPARCRRASTRPTAWPNRGGQRAQRGGPRPACWGGGRGGAGHTAPARSPATPAAIPGGGRTRRVRVLPRRRSTPHRPRRWLALMERPWCCTPSLTVVVCALAWRAHRRRCPPVGRVPTYWQRALGTTPLVAAYPPHRSAALPREASASVEAVCSGIVLALLCRHGCPGAQPPPAEPRYARRMRIAHGGNARRPA